VLKGNRRSLSFNKRWPPLRKRRIRSVTSYGPSYRSESFELHKKIASSKKVQFSAAAKFTTAITTLGQSSWTHGSARPTQISWTLDHRCFARAVIKRCTTFGRAVVSVSRADTELKELCRALNKRSIAVIKFCLALVCLCGTNARFRLLPLRQRYNNAGAAVHLVFSILCTDTSVVEIWKTNDALNRRLNF